ncbi:MAG: putative O-glycosylation ligase, exosortase A system-associated, partial [Novosphingobium sp.]
GWTINYAKEHPLGGGFEAYRSNRLTFETRAATTEGNTTSVETNLMTDEGRAYHSSYFEMLGEQGYPGLVLWLLIQVTGLWQMERVRARWRKKAAAPGSGTDQQWQAPLANALQQAQLVYLLGSFFIGIAYQPFILMLIGLQCGLFSYLKRTESAEHVTVRAPYRLKLPKAASAP